MINCVRTVLAPNATLRVQRATAQDCIPREGDVLVRGPYPFMRQDGVPTPQPSTGTVTR
jgi:hypothetical protein